MTDRYRFRAGVLLAAALLLCPPAPAHAQVPTRAEVDSLRAELARLQAQLDSLRRAMAPPVTTDSVEDAVARLRAAAAAAVSDTTAAAPAVAEGEFVSRQRNLSVFNPEISVTGDIFAFVNTETPGQDNFVPREFEIALQSNLDPYSRAKVFVAHHMHGGEIEPFADDGEDGHDEEGSSVEIEEGYVEWVNLPGGLGVTLGQFRQRFGKYNRWHPHALPTQQLPLPYVAYLGEEGLAQAGVSVHWLAPIHGPTTWEVWFEATRSSATPFGESHRMSMLGHVNAFWQISPATYFELGGTGMVGPYKGDFEDVEYEADWGTRLLGLDATFDWTPPDRAKFRQATLHGGVVWSSHDVEDLVDATAFGAFVNGEYKLGQRWWVGAHYEYVQDPFDPDRSSWLTGPTLTWWQSEFVRLRAEYEIVSRPDGRFGQFVLQTTFAMGPHKHETY